MVEEEEPKRDFSQRKRRTYSVFTTITLSVPFIFEVGWLVGSYCARKLSTGTTLTGMRLSGDERNEVDKLIPVNVVKLNLS